MYHTGRVLGHITTVLAKEIWKRMGARCTVLAMSKNSQTLIPPGMLSVSLDRDVDKKEVRRLVEECVLDADYLRDILETPLVR